MFDTEATSSALSPMPTGGVDGNGGLSPAHPVRDLFRHLKSSKLGIVGVVMTTGLILTALVGPSLPYVKNQPAQDLRNRLKPPLLWGGTWDHPLGTDQLGRDMLARLIEAAQVSVFVGASAVVLSSIVGVTLGLIAGYRGGWFDSSLMGLSDVQIAIPGILLGIMLVAAFGPSVRTVILIIFLSGWVVFARVTRGQVLTLKNQLFVEAGELSGCKPSRMMRCPPPSQSLVVAADPRRARVLGCHPHGVCVLVPRVRCEASRLVVGVDHRPGPHVCHHCVVDRHLRRPRHRRGCVRHEPAGLMAPIVRTCRRTRTSPAGGK